MNGHAPAAGRGRGRAFGFLLVEVFLIVLGVLLGLAANEWRVERDNHQRAKSALDYISRELDVNRQQIAGLIDYHRALNDSLTALTAGGAASVTFDDLRRAMPQGFAVPLIQSNAWDVARSTGAVENMELRTAILLSRVYDLQDFYRGKLERVADNLYLAGNLDVERSDRLAFALRNLANDIVLHEEDLLTGYEMTIARLDSLRAD
ncbi:MAG: hypothetical protein JW819_11570 [Candidatus Krumholzibacteriota bacterium]|nr:hypothetical protein [Candidatus Krumholzibacteriota bacterium]